MATSAELVLRGSRPTKLLSESPFQRVGNLFNRHVQPLDTSGELFRRPTVDPALEAFTPTLEHLDKQTVRVNLKRPRM